ncbi:hypothetical protein XF_1279 [Xylella fastidiosa 9a5c]|uniref:Uncharacterized protein n=1 Tax=Xylella fastidiosa (strain 9a5c) TaxID=160492 RepID=Q9PDV0_XYLFA|nr:hypothetical protein XF_1279 [Xylella fastidiosa 9a5c]
MVYSNDSIYIVCKCGSKKENQKLYKYSNWVGLIIFRFFHFLVITWELQRLSG